MSNHIAISAAWTVARPRICPAAEDRARHYERHAATTTDPPG
ncbi:hypothetical protein [Nonomuraea maheshkhaliensis]